MSGELHGRTALVTGSTANLGYAIAAACAEAGARVVVHGPAQEEAEAARARLAAEHPQAEFHAVAFNLARPEEIERGFASLAGRGLMPDVLVNNAAHLGLGEAGFLEQSPAFFREVIETNLMGTFRCSQLAAAHMKARGGGAVVTISSLAGERAIHGRSAYNAGKGALDALTRSMALDLAPHGIRVNAIAPGYVWTPRWNAISEDAATRRRTNIPAGEPTQPEEIARLVVFLASDAAPTLTGSILDFDGGLNAQQVPRDCGL